MDPQDGLFTNINTKEGSYYFNNINYKNSFIVRLDNKLINENILKFNDNKYILEFNENIDLKYLR